MARHPDLTDAELHVPAYVQSSDPGAVGAGIGWIDTSLGTGAWVWKIRNAGDTDWEEIAAGSVTGPPAPSLGIPNYDGRGDGSFGLVCPQVRVINYEPSTTSFTGNIVNSEPDGLISTFSDSDPTGAGFLALPGTVVFHATLTDDTNITILDDGEGNLSNPTYNVTGTMSYDGAFWNLTFNGLVPKTGTDITVDGEALFGTPTASISVFDCIKAIHGGSGDFSYTISDAGSGYGPNSDLDPTLAIITYTCGIDTPQLYLIDINVFDNILGVTAYGQLQLVLQDINGLCP
jgi:hypothetical protein